MKISKRGERKRQSNSKHFLYYRQRKLLSIGENIISNPLKYRSSCDSFGNTLQLYLGNAPKDNRQDIKYLFSNQATLVKATWCRQLKRWRVAFLLTSLLADQANIMPR